MRLVAAACCDVRRLISQEIPEQPLYFKLRQIVRVKNSPVPSGAQSVEMSEARSLMHMCGNTSQHIEGVSLTDPAVFE